MTSRRHGALKYLEILGKYIIIPIGFVFCYIPVFVAIVIAFGSALCFDAIKRTDFNPKRRYKKRKEDARLREEKRIRDERLAIVGEEWDKGRKARMERRRLPKMLEGRERVTEIVWNGQENQQDQCLLYRLPRELRDMIWTEIAGGYLVHLSWLSAYSRFQAPKCRIGDGCIGRPCAKEGICGKVDLLNYLLICRRIYTEMLPCIYGHNCFDFRHLYEVLRFSLTIPFQQMSMIQKAQWKDEHHPQDPAIRNGNELKYSPLPGCKGVEQNCYCLRCWKREDWDKHYEDRCRSWKIEGSDVICWVCWTDNPAFNTWD